MARPEEKAQAMLNKWVKMKEEGDPTSKLSRTARRNEKRPFLASHCEHLADAERFRRQILGEIADGVKKIQNAGLGEHAVRDLNDTINKLIREKWHWNRRIKELGGSDFNKEERKATLRAAAEGGTGPEGGEDPQLAAGASLKGSGGYRYFGAARELPGVKELFARQAAKIAKRRRGDVYKYIAPDYYGLRDEEDGVLPVLEARMAEENRERLRECREEYAAARKRRKREREEAGGDQSGGWEDDDEGGSADEGLLLDELKDGIPANAAVPSQEEVARALLRKKKEALLTRFG
ncbi:hypothetical protein ACHAWF_009541 [Thalassiosira exigua]